MICELCNKEHNGTYGSGRFCSIRCSRGFSTLHKRQKINILVSNKLSNLYKITFRHECKGCKSLTSNNTYCSNSCRSKSLWKEVSYSQNISYKMKEKVQNGIHSGWMSRSKISYAESYFVVVLTNLGLLFKREHKVGKYFIDFAFLEDKVALEIDGKQHELPGRKEADSIKDIFLTSLGWRVFRIKWYNPSSKYKDKLYDQIKEFKLYKGVVSSLDGYS